MSYLVIKEYGKALKSLAQPPQKVLGQKQREDVVFSSNEGRSKNLFSKKKSLTDKVVKKAKVVKKTKAVDKAISTPMKFETRPAQTSFTLQRDENFRDTVYDDSYSFGDSSSHYSHFYNALDMNPRNMFPYSQYESSMSAEDPSLIQNVLLKGLSGHGSHKDSLPIQRAVIHSLKKYPPLLRMYLNSAQLTV